LPASERLQNEFAVSGAEDKYAPFQKTQLSEHFLQAYGLAAGAEKKYAHKKDDHQDVIAQLADR
jgi:hypothetical protein